MSTKKTDTDELVVSSSSGHRRAIKAREVKPWFMDRFGDQKEVEITNKTRGFIDLGTVGEKDMFWGSADDAKVDFKENPHCPKPTMVVEVRYIKALLTNECMRRVFESLCESGDFDVRPIIVRKQAA